MSTPSRKAVRSLAALAFVVAAAAGERSAAAETKIAVVDLQRATLTTEDGIRAQATMKKRFDKRQLELDAKRTELGRVQEDIEKQARILSREALQKRSADLQQQLVKLQTVYVEYQQELAKMQNELMGPILKKMSAVIGRIAKKNGYEIILDKQATPYVRPDLDLTDQVIQLYNSGGDAGDSGGGDEKKPDAPK
jgi:outer membrane protein